MATSIKQIYQQSKNLNQLNDISEPKIFFELDQLLDYTKSILNRKPIDGTKKSKAYVKLIIIYQYFNIYKI